MRNTPKSWHKIIHAPTIKFRFVFSKRSNERRKRTMSRKRSRKTLLEISNQPELWIFSNLLAEDWITRKDIKESAILISLPLATFLPTISLIIFCALVWNDI